MVPGAATVLPSPAKSGEGATLLALAEIPGEQQDVWMKTTLDLPDALVYEVKRRAILGNRKLKDTVAELLQKGLEAAETEQEALIPAIVGIDEVTGLPIIKVPHAALPGQEITPQRIFEILLEQEVEWYAQSR